MPSSSEVKKMSSPLAAVSTLKRRSVRLKQKQPKNITHGVSCGLNNVAAENKENAPNNVSSSTSAASSSSLKKLSTSNIDSLDRVTQDQEMIADEEIASMYLSSNAVSFDNEKHLQAVLSLLLRKMRKGMKTNDHIKGLLNIIAPGDLVTHSEYEAALSNHLPYLLDRINPTLLHFVMDYGEFHGELISNYVVETLEQSQKQHGLDPDAQFGAYGRFLSIKCGDLRDAFSRINDDLREKFPKAVSFFEKKMERLSEVDNDTEVCLLYIGETSAQLINVRRDQENHQTIRDGADAQWELFNLLQRLLRVDPTHIQLAQVDAGDKGTALKLEATILSIVEAKSNESSIVTSGLLSETRLLASVGGGLNQMNGGLAHFLVNGGSSKLILSFLISNSNNLRGVSIYDEDFIPPSIKQLCRDWFPQISECNSGVDNLSDIRVNHLLETFGGYGWRKRVLNLQKQMEEDTTFEEAEDELKKQLTKQLQHPDFRAQVSMYQRVLYDNKSHNFQRDDVIKRNTQRLRTDNPLAAQQRIANMDTVEEIAKKMLKALETCSSEEDAIAILSNFENVRNMRDQVREVQVVPSTNPIFIDAEAEEKVLPKIQGTSVGLVVRPPEHLDKAFELVKALNVVMTKSSLFSIKNPDMCRNTILGILKPRNDLAPTRQQNTKNEGDEDFIAIARSVPLGAFFCIRTRNHANPARYQGELPTTISNNDATFINHYGDMDTRTFGRKLSENEEKFKVKKFDQKMTKQLTKSWPERSKNVAMYQVVKNLYYDNK
ncbi:hypothetical protein ACHAWC_006084 [Mediolabrus comicus]